MWKYYHHYFKQLGKKWKIEAAIHEKRLKFSNYTRLDNHKMRATKSSLGILVLFFSSFLFWTPRQLFFIHKMIAKSSSALDSEVKNVDMSLTPFSPDA